MTICAQKFDVAPVGFPILEAPTPVVVSILWARFGGRVNVVDVEGAIIGEAALNALPAERAHKLNLPLPVAVPFVLAVAVSVPVILLAARVAKSRFARSATGLALSSFSPAMRQVACLAAELARTIFEPVGVHFNRFAAVLARDGDAWVSHANILSNYRAHSNKPRYFDIACERIRKAYEQPDFFIERPKPAKQQALL